VSTLREERTTKSAKFSSRKVFICQLPTTVEISYKTFKCCKTKRRYSMSTMVRSNSLLKQKTYSKTKVSNHLTICNFQTSKLISYSGINFKSFTDKKTTKLVPKIKTLIFERVCFRVITNIFLLNGYISNIVCCL